MELSLSVDSRLSRGYKAFAGLQRDEIFQSTGTSRMASAAFLGRGSLIPTQRHLFAPVTVVFSTGCMWCCPWFLRALCYLAWRCSLTQMDVTRCPCPAAQFLPQRFFFPKKCCGLFLCVLGFVFTVCALCPIPPSHQRVRNVYFLTSSCHNTFLIASFLQGTFKCLLWWNPDFCIYSLWFPWLISSVSTFSCLYSWFTFPFYSL